MWLGPQYRSGENGAPSTPVKMAVIAPIPRATLRATTAVNLELLAQTRRA